jgi:hypothetical protein
MSHSIYTADGRAHVKIVAISLVCATLVAAVGIFAQVSEVDPGAASVVKAGRVTAVGGHLPVIR